MLPSFFSIQLSSAGVDKKGSGASSWGDDASFGELVTEIDTQSGWVHGVSFSPSGDQLALVTHNSAISFCAPKKEPIVIKMKELPLKVVAFLSENTVVAAGYDNEPFLFQKKGDAWSLVQKLDKKKDAAKPAAAGPSNTSAAFSKFQQATRVGTDAGAKPAEGASPDTTHQNAISCLALIKKDNKVNEFSTSGYDGRLVRWHVDGLEKAFAGLKI